ncbi:hypothetical protein BU23DRAFT_71557 [Bimuria novae-zelandiae CBS 107.79]|uniref:Uncharacterized protein n=1 Tax=Bimuria novae-zelandiae CBS 107.79 TaxID=1447943 RepID=A0A6A5USU4_9PLEO|nr:hypothetical protein BU23DRAFT_71557 [Bimuria novae-zelandiae CBS 107.79]
MRGGTVSTRCGFGRMLMRRLQCPQPLQPRLGAARGHTYYTSARRGKCYCYLKKKYSKTLEGDCIDKPTVMLQYRPQTSHPRDTSTCPDPWERWTMNLPKMPNHATAPPRDRSQTHNHNPK